MAIAFSHFTALFLIIHEIMFTLILSIMNLSDSQCSIHFCSEIAIAKVFFFLSYIYWADWNRDAPKIEMAYMDGTNRRVLAKGDLGLPNGLTYDPKTSLLCWADAGTAPVH